MNAQLTLRLPMRSPPSPNPRPTNQLSANLLAISKAMRRGLAQLARDTERLLASFSLSSTTRTVVAAAAVAASASLIVRSNAAARRGHEDKDEDQHAVVYKPNPLARSASVASAAATTAVSTVSFSPSHRPTFDHETHANSDNGACQRCLSRPRRRADWNSMHHLNYNPKHRRGATREDTLPRFLQTSMSADTLMFGKSLASSHGVSSSSSSTTSSSSSSSSSSCSSSSPSPPSSSFSSMSVDLDATLSHQEAVQSPNRKTQTIGRYPRLGEHDFRFGTDDTESSSSFGGVGGFGRCRGLLSTPSYAAEAIRLRWERLNSSVSAKSNIINVSRKINTRAIAKSSPKGATNDQSSNTVAPTETGGQFEGWWALFEEADTDGDGKLELRDVYRLLRRTLKLSSSELPAKQVDELFHFLDADGSGLLSFEDLGMIFSGELVRSYLCTSLSSLLHLSSSLSTGTYMHALTPTNPLMRTHARTHARTRLRCANTISNDCIKSKFRFLTW